MIYLVLLTVWIILVIIILNFKRQKKKYLPINFNEMTPEQEFYVIKILKQFERSCLSEGILVVEHTDETIYKIRNKELSTREKEKLNKFLLNRTIKIGVFNFK